jgi:CheY-like chemotaxis protein
MDARSKTVLYADDDADDKLWVTEACKAIDSSLQIEFVANGRDVLNYLSSTRSGLPVLIVLDLNMPELDGRQTLRRLKGDEQYKNIPVIIVTTSSNKVDREVCQRLGADLYLIKPDTHSEWQNIIRRMEPFVVNGEL